MHKSMVYLVGAGPGNSKLITIRGLELIKMADCIIYDYLVNAELLKFKKKGCKLIYTGKKSGRHTLAQDDINQLLASKAKVYPNVVRLKGGDPFIFGRGAEETAYLRKKKINFEVVPGVTSAIAVPAYAGIPLTERSRTSTVGFIAGHEDSTKIDSSVNWSALTKALGTMVFLMGAGNLDSIVKRLLVSGKAKDTPIALIEWGTTAKQRTLTGTLEDIRKLSRKNKITPPVIIVVGETVRLRKELNWFEKKPLFAKRIIVTRPREQADLLSEKLRELGAEVIIIPTIKIVSQKADKQLKSALLSDKYDWIFFTSQNGVSEFAEFLKRLKKDIRILGNAKICSLGPETAKGLHRLGIKPDYIPSRFVCEAVVRHFKNMEFKAGAAPLALILQAKKARHILARGLKEAGFRVKVVNLYNTVLPQGAATGLKEAFKERVDFVTFTSSSSVVNFIKLLGRDYRQRLSGVGLASIGPITSGTLEKFGLKVDVEAKVYTAEGLVKAIARKTLTS